MSWSCPRSARSFAHEGQLHSHDTVGVDDHFAGRAEMLRESFDTLVRSLPVDVHIEALRSVIIVSARTTFAFITVQAKRLMVGVFLDRRLDSPRVVKVDVNSSQKVRNVVDVRSPDDVDDEPASGFARRTNSMPTRLEQN